MTHSLLPSRGIFVPTQMVFNTQLPSVVMLTWIQLRCLAWRGWATPPLSLPELASLIGIHPARLQRHLAELQDASALVCRSTKDGRLILSFPEEPIFVTEPKTTEAQVTRPEISHSLDRGSPETVSYFPDRILGYISYQEDPEPLDITNDFEQVNIGLEKVEKCY
jgi:hypothetical protein